MICRHKSLGGGPAEVARRACSCQSTFFVSSTESAAADWLSIIIQAFCSRGTCPHVGSSQVSVEYFMTVGLGLGATRHGERPADGEVGRKGISCERTFSALSAPSDLEAKVLLVVWALQGMPRSYLHRIISSPLSSLVMKSKTVLHIHYRIPP